MYGRRLLPAARGLGREEFVKPGELHRYLSCILGAAEPSRPWLTSKRLAFLVLRGQAVEGVPERLGVAGATFVCLRRGGVDRFGRQHEALGLAGCGGLDQWEIRERIRIDDDPLEVSRPKPTKPALKSLNPSSEM
jgi:hypothetical protein